MFYSTIAILALQPFVYKVKKYEVNYLFNVCRTCIRRNELQPGCKNA